MKVKSRKTSNISNLPVRMDYYRPEDIEEFSRYHVIHDLCQIHKDFLSWGDERQHWVVFLDEDDKIEVRYDHDIDSYYTAVIKAGDPGWIVAVDL